MVHFAPFPKLQLNLKMVTVTSGYAMKEVQGETFKG